MFYFSFILRFFVCLKSSFFVKLVDFPGYFLFVRSIFLLFFFVQCNKFVRYAIWINFPSPVICGLDRTETLFALTHIHIMKSNGRKRNAPHTDLFTWNGVYPFLSEGNDVFNCFSLSLFLSFEMYEPFDTPTKYRYMFIYYVELFGCIYSNRMLKKYRNWENLFKRT